MGSATTAGKTLYLLRHAKSSWKDPDAEDFDRPLNKRGKLARDIMARYFQSANLRPDLVLCSAAKRARSTVKPILPVIGEPAIRYEDAIYHASPASILDILHEVEDAVASVLVVGHSPGVDELALCLAEDDDGEMRSRMIAKFPTAALAILTSEVDRWRDLSLGTARLQSFIRPRDLEEH